MYRSVCCTQTHIHKQTPFPGMIDSSTGCQDALLKGTKAPLDWLSAFKHHSPYTRERCVTQWCCQRNQTPFPLRWRRSKSYRHRPLGCPWAGSPVCRQSRQRPGLKETQHEQYCQPTGYEILASRERRPNSLLRQHKKNDSILIVSNSGLLIQHTDSLNMWFIS